MTITELITPPACGCAGFSGVILGFLVSTWVNFLAFSRPGFVVAPYNTPEEVPSVKSVSGPARHVGEADKRVRDSRGGSPCGENRCGIGECREGEGTRGAPQERAKLTRTIFHILRSEVSSIEKYDAPRRMVFFYLADQLWRPRGTPG